MFSHNDLISYVIGSERIENGKLEIIEHPGFRFVPLIY